MTLVRFEPFRELENIGRRVNDRVNEFVKMMEADGGGWERNRFVPRVDVAEDEKNLYIHAELPGMTKENVQVTVDDERILTIRGEKKQEEQTEDKKKNFVRIERNYGSFTRSFTLPDNVNAEAISAAFENGVLNVTLPKMEPAKPKEVNIAIQ